MTTQFICECGKILLSSQSFNGHKSNCRVHLEATGKWEARQQSRKIGAQKFRQSIKISTQKQKESKLIKWCAEQHVCECCGKVMTEKFGSGRFCSRACANTRKHSIETKAKLKISAKLASPAVIDARRSANETAYLTNPKTCKICGQILPYDLRERITCSNECYNKLRADIRINTMENLGISNGFKSTFKYGFYQGIECDSGWELAFLLYQLAQGANIKRNNRSFEYFYNGRLHQYYPDFVIDNVYYEIKGYKDAAFFEKIKQFPSNEKLIVIDSSVIDTYLDFAIKTFGENFYTLYDHNRPNWMKSNES